MEKQDCAVRILKYLQQKKHLDLTKAIDYCEEVTDEHGLSIYDLCAGLRLSGIKADAYHTLQIPRSCFIAFIGSDKYGHFILAQRMDKKIWIYDPRRGEALMSMMQFFLIWRKTLILLDVN